MPAPPAEMATSPPPPSSSAPSSVSALSAAVEVLGVAKRNFGAKKRRQTLTTASRDPADHRADPRRAGEDPVRPSRRADVKAAPGALGRASSVGASRSTVLTMASTASLSSSSSSSSSLSRGQSFPASGSGLAQGYSEEEEPAGRSLPPLGADKQRALVDFIDRSVDDAYKLCHGFGRVRWAPSKTREGVAIHRARGEDDAILDAAVRGQCNVTATVGELLDALITESTAAFVAHESAVNPAEFLDGQVLHTLVPRTPDDRFACVKWHCVRSLAPSVAKHRDYVYVELVDKFRDAGGRLVGYRLSKSVELDALPASRTAHVFVRAKTLTLQTFAETSPGAGTLELTTMMINDLGERLPAWLVHKIVDTAAMRTACLRDHLNQRRIDLLVYASPKDMVPLRCALGSGRRARRSSCPSNLALSSLAPPPLSMAASASAASCAPRASPSCARSTTASPAETSSAASAPCTSSCRRRRWRPTGPAPAPARASARRAYASSAAAACRPASCRGAAGPCGRAPSRPRRAARAASARTWSTAASSRTRAAARRPWTLARPP
jgi:hypothetical protein